MKTIKLWLFLAVTGLAAVTSFASSIPMSQLDLTDETGYTAMDVMPALGPSDGWLSSTGESGIISSYDASAATFLGPQTGLPAGSGSPPAPIIVWPSLLLIAMGGGVLLSLRWKMAQPSSPPTSEGG
ncbi:MAG TPA: hypothetical protein VGO59_10940 [Verrucomicrobiae bacterium]